jgi:AraC-like DNA-binding protein
MNLVYFFGYPEFVVLLSRAIDVEVHAHHALQLTFSLQGSLILQHDEQQTVARGIFVSRGQPHLVDSQGRPTVNYLIRTESPLGKRLQHRFADQSTDVVEQVFPTIPDDWSRLTCEEMRRISTGLWSGLLDPHRQPEQETDPRIQKAIEHIKKMEIVKVSAETLAQLVHLSPSRFMYLFRQETGTSVRRYVLWDRLVKAIMEIMQGASFTVAAHQVGFSDAPHLTRTFKRMFGITLQDVFLNEAFIQASFCMDQTD